MDLSELYQDVIRDHSKSPKNKRVIDPADRQADGHNPLCGDRVTVFLTLDQDTVVDVAFEGEACALCTASSSLLTQQIKDKTLAEANKLGQLFIESLTSQVEPEYFDTPIESLAPLSGVRQYPMRVKCVTLPWHTLKAAIADAHDSDSTQQVSTES